MGCRKRRGLRRDRYRDIQGEGTRRTEVALQVRREARRTARAARPAPGRGGWRGVGCPRSARQLRNDTLETIRAFDRRVRGDDHYGGLLLDSVVSHRKMATYRSESSIKSVKENAATDLLVKNLSEALSNVKHTHSQNQVVAKRTALQMVVSQETLDRRMASTSARLLGLSRKNLRNAAERRSRILALPPMQRTWAIKSRAARSDSFSEVVKAYIKAFWHNNTRPSPKAKDRVKDTQKHYLHVSQTELYTMFQEHFHSEQKFPGVICPAQRYFERLKPFYVYQETDRDVCCCKYHVEIDMLKKGFNHLRKSSHGPHCVCTCDVCTSSPILEQQREVDPTDGSSSSSLIRVEPLEGEAQSGCEDDVHTSRTRPEHRCKAGEKDYDSVRGMCSSTLCDKVHHEPLNRELHRLECVMGNCAECGFSKKFPMCQANEVLDVTDLHNWSRFEQVVDGVDDTGKERTRPGIVQKETSKQDFVDYLDVKIREFIKHDFVYRWQDLQFKQSMAIFLVGTVLSVIDYAENYTMAPQDEIQADHWTSTQVTILVHIVYFHLPESTHADRKIGKACHYYVSDDRKHDSPFVQNAFKLLDAWLLDEGIEYQQHWVWSDGAPTQFKNNVNFYFVSRYPRVSGGRRMTWSFFGPGHGKGEHDGMGAVVKRWLRHYQLDRMGVRLENAESVVRLLNENLQLGTRSTFYKRQRHALSIRRIFHHIPDGCVDRSEDLSCNTIHGTRNKIFQIMGCTIADHTLLHSRPFACFCPTCVFGEYENCVNKAYTGGSWEIQKLVPKGSIPTDLQVDSISGPDGDHLGMSQVHADYDTLANLLTEGSYFAVRAPDGNEENVPYYILQCTNQLETLRQPRTHVWNDTTFMPTETIVTGTYMRRAGRTPVKYKWESNRSPCIVYSHLVIAINLLMVPESAKERKRWGRSVKCVPSQVVYNLREEDHEAMLRQLDEPSNIFNDMA